MVNFKLSLSGHRVLRFLKARFGQVGKRCIHEFSSVEKSYGSKEDPIKLMEIVRLLCLRNETIPKDLANTPCVTSNAIVNRSHFWTEFFERGSIGYRQV